MAALTDGTTTYSPAVLTSSAADTHLNEVVKPTVTDVTQGIQNQSATQAANKAAQDQAAATAASTELDTQKKQTDIAVATGKQALIAKQLATSGSPGEYKGIVIQPGTDEQVSAQIRAIDSQQGNTPSPGSSSGTTTPAPDPNAESKKVLAQAEAEYQNQAKEVHDTILNIQNGTIPLNAGEQAQVAGLQQQFQQLIQQQTLANKSASGLANIRGYQKGAAEYDPTFQVKTIGSIITAGQNKIADLNIKMSSAVAALTQSLKDNDIAAVKDAWDIYQTASKNRTTAIQQTIDDTNAQIKAANDAHTKQTNDINEIAQQASKNTAPSDIIKAITSSGNVADAIAAAGDYLQEASGEMGEYLTYSRLAKSKGQVPVGYFDYLSAKKRASTTSSGSGSGGAASSDDISQIADAIISGNQPPIVTGLYGKTAAVRAELQRRGYNYTSANQDWTATQKLFNTLNGAQQTRLRQAVNQVDDSLTLVQSLADDWNGGGFPVLNAASLIAAKNGLYGQEAASLATRLDAEIADITSELGTVYKGGNSSTDESLKLAAQNLQSNWSRETFDDAVALAKQNITIRKNSLNLTTAGVTESNYNPTTGKLIDQNANNPLNVSPAVNQNNPLSI